MGETANRGKAATPPEIWHFTACWKPFSEELPAERRLAGCNIALIVTRCSFAPRGNIGDCHSRLETRCRIVALDFVKESRAILLATLISLALPGRFSISAVPRIKWRYRAMSCDSFASLQW